MAHKLEIRKNIYNLVGLFPESEILGIFLNLNISRRTIYRTIAECEPGISYINLPKSGRPGSFTRVRSEGLIRRSKKIIGTSTRKLSTSFQLILQKQGVAFANSSIGLMN